MNPTLKYIPECVQRSFGLSDCSMLIVIESDILREEFRDRPFNMSFSGTLMERAKSVWYLHLTSLGEKDCHAYLICRGLLARQPGSACQQWGATCLTNKPSHGKFLLLKRILSIVWPSLSLTGHLCEDYCFLSSNAIGKLESGESKFKSCNEEKS